MFIASKNRQRQIHETVLLHYDQQITNDKIL